MTLKSVGAGGRLGQEPQGLRPRTSRGLSCGGAASRPTYFYSGRERGRVAPGDYSPGLPQIWTCGTGTQENRYRFVFSGEKRTDITRSSGKEDSRKLETFQMEPCG